MVHDATTAGFVAQRNVGRGHFAVFESRTTLITHLISIQIGQYQRQIRFINQDAGKINLMSQLTEHHSSIAGIAATLPVLS